MSVKVAHHVAPNSSGVRTVYASVRYPYGSPPDEIEIAGTAYARENAKLRELVRRYGEYTDQDHCEGCVCKSRCNEGEVAECWQLTEIRGLECELGIEVDG